MKKIVLLALACLFIVGVVHAAETKTIRFATEATYPPFEYVNAAGDLQGFDIALAKALCAEMKAQCTFSNQSFASLIPSLKLGKFDALISALGVTEARKKQVAFTDSYYEPSAVFVGAITKHYTLGDLSGKTVGVQQGSTFEKYLQAKYGKQVIQKSYASIQDAFLDLVSGRVDVVIADTPIASDWLKQDDNQTKYAVIDKAIKDAEYFGAGYGIAVRQDDTALLNALNAALAAIKKNGSYDKITRQYF